MNEELSESKDFVERVEQYSHRAMHFPGEVAQLLEAVRGGGTVQAFEEAMFHAKFVSNTQEVMKRIGAGAEGYDKLASEFQSSVERVTSLIRSALERGPEEVSRNIETSFFSLNPESFGKLLQLCGDLALIKNWQIDGRPMPYDPSTSTQRLHEQSGTTSAKREGHSQEATARRTRNIRSSAILGILLLLAFVVVDPPVTVIGWTLIVLALGLLSNIFVLLMSAGKEG